MVRSSDPISDPRAFGLGPAATVLALIPEDDLANGLGVAGPAYRQPMTSSNDQGAPVTSAPDPTSPDSYYRHAESRAGAVHQALLSRTLSQVFTAELFIRSILVTALAGSGPWAQEQVNDLLQRANLSRKITLVESLLNESDESPARRGEVIRKLRALDQLRNKFAHTGLVAHGDATLVLLAGRLRDGVSVTELPAAEVEATLEDAEAALAVLLRRYMP